MIRLERAGRQYPVATNDVYVGAGVDCTIHIDLPGVEPRHALVKTMDDGSVAVQRLSEAAEVYVNGVLLGANPTPLLHGDRLTVAGEDILVVEPEQVGSTQHINVADLANAVGAPSQAATVVAGELEGGRLVCLTDGREYTVGIAGIFFGRDATSDIVVLSGEVSRRHAQILPTPRGYVINDSSTNGTYVNGDRIDGSRVLNRSDVIRIGADEFRFYADPVAQPAKIPAEAASPSAVLEPAPQASPPTPAAPGAPPPGASARLNNTMMGMAAFNPRGLESTPAGPAATLATLLVRQGPMKGERFVITVPVANIGRADYNDVVVNDESVSQAHAKLQRREEVWVLSDLGSTNGTMVDGERISEETPLSPGATIQFGEVPLLFDPTDQQSDIEYQPGTKVMPKLPFSPPAQPASTRGHKAGEPIPVRRPGPRIVATPSPSKHGLWWAVAVVIVAAAAAAAYYFLRMR